VNNRSQQNKEVKMAYNGDIMVTEDGRRIVWVGNSCDGRWVAIETQIGGCCPICQKSMEYSRIFRHYVCIQCDPTVKIIHPIFKIITYCIFFAIGLLIGYIL